MADPQDDDPQHRDPKPDDETDDDSDERPVVPELRRPPPNPRKALPLLIGPIIVMIAMTNLGNALFPSLVQDKPELLLLLNSQNRYLALTAGNPNLSTVAYYGIGMFRLLIPDPFFYLLGFWYGETVIRWIETKSETYGLAIRQMEKIFDKASWVVVTIFPNNYVCLIAGTARMNPVAFLILDVIGTAGRLVLFQIFGLAFQDQLQAILDFITKYRWQLTAVSVALVAFTLIRDWRAGRGQIEAIIDLEEEIETDYDAGTG